MKLRECITHANLALRLGQFDYAAELCQAVLAAFPYHLKAHSLLGQALLDKGYLSDAGDHFEAILVCDPENVIARSGLAVVLERQGQLRRAIDELQRAFEVSPGHVEVRETLLSLRSQLERVRKGLEITPAAASRILLKRGRYAEAIEASRKALSASPNRLDLMLCKAESLWHMGRRSEAEQSCREILRRYPSVLKAKLILASLLIQNGAHAEGVSLLHEALTADPSMMVARGILRDAGLIVPVAEETIDLPGIARTPPYEVKAALAAGLPTDLAEEPVPEDLPLIEVDSQDNGERSGKSPESLADIVEAISGTVVGVKRAKAKPPTKGLFLIVTSAASLARKYGQDKLIVVDRKLSLLAEALGAEGYAATVLYVDSREALAKYGLSPVNARSAEAVRSLIDQFEARAGVQPLESRCVLLVGGDEIVPFHRLANPTDDDDAIVLSDAPYAGSGPSNFAPVRAVGRLPDEESRSPALLLYLIDSITARHGYGVGRPERKGLLGLLPPAAFTQRNGKLHSAGCTALVWRRATETVYEAIGDRRTLRVSPPMTDRGIEPAWFADNQVSLFNLHGAENSPFWYGQKDASYPADYPLFPVALSAELLKTMSFTDSVIISEACYGANIIKKTASDSIALQFLKTGAACVIGSTKIAYGSGEPPLVGADLLAKLLWQQLAIGKSVGEALVIAKTGFVREVQDRQGYLDGDDQKTVLEFIVLGDPTVTMAKIKPQPKDVVPVECADPDFCPSLYCQRKSQGKDAVRAPGEVMAKVRRFLQKAAPEVLDNQLSVLSREICLSGKRKTCHGTCLLKEDKRAHANTYLVTAKRAILAADGAAMHRVARVTVDPQGSILKLAVSK